jgi:hypothetical protein
LKFSDQFLQTKQWTAQKIYINWDDENQRIIVRICWILSFNLEDFFFSFIPLFFPSLFFPTALFKYLDDDNLSFSCFYYHVDSDAFIASLFTFFYGLSFSNHDDDDFILVYLTAIASRTELEWTREYEFVWQKLNKIILWYPSYISFQSPLLVLAYCAIFMIFLSLLFYLNNSTLLNMYLLCE